MRINKKTQTTRLWSASRLSKALCGVSNMLLSRERRVRALNISQKKMFTIVLFLCCSVVFLFLLDAGRRSAGEIVTITVVDPVDREYHLFYDNGKKGEYPFSSSIPAKHIGSTNKSALVFHIPFGSSAKLRLDFYKSANEEKSEVKLYEIRVRALGKEKILTAKGIADAFSPYPEGNEFLEGEYVMFSYSDDVVLYGAQNIPYNSEFKWEMEYLNMGICSLLSGLLLFLLILLVIFVQKLPNKKRLWVNHVLYMLFSSVLLMLGASILQHDSLIGVAEQIKNNPKYCLITIFTIFCLLDLLASIIGKAYANVIISTMLVFLCVVNIFKIKYRESPFFPSDLLLSKELNSILDGLDLTLSSNMILGIVLFLSIIVASIVIAKKYKDRFPQNRKKIFFVKFGVVGAVIYFLYFSALAVPGSGFDPIADYEKKGVVVGFLSNIQTMRRPKLNGYSENKVLQAMNNMTSRENHDDIRPNIIIIMSESFWDIEEFPGIEYEHELFPVYRRLQEEAVTGTILTSVFGGGTSTTEFEVLTGFSKQFLPLETTAYYNLRRLTTGDVFSVAQYLKAGGYKTMAIHPFLGKNYNRNVVYPNMGFDEFITADDFENPKSMRSFISDEAMVEKMIELYENHLENSEEPFFQFAVSVQNHPDYSASRWSGDEELMVSVTTPDISDSARDSLDDLATGLYYSDKALGELIAYFEHREEPVIIVMFGDHASKVGNTVDEIYYDLGMLSEKEAAYEHQYVQHRTPFMAWSNYKQIQSEEGVIASSFLLPVIFEKYGIESPSWFDFLYEVKNVCPGNSLNVVLHKDGSYSSSMTEDERAVYETYELLQYDYLYGKQWGRSVFQ